MPLPENWWKGSVLYQIYPRSFADSNNDGIGDLNGITDNLDYLKDLGIKGIWISPFYPSPMKDFGYDVSNFRDVDPIFGTLQDFDNLLNEANKRGLGIIIDLAFSHTSDEHPWFIDSFQSGKHKDWYVWADAKEDGSPPNNWVSVFGGSAWEYNNSRGQYYLHNFLKEQPDLNFHNEDVQSEVLDIAKFWLDRGGNGFRLDVANFYFHDELLRDNPPRLQGTKYATQFEGEDPYSNQQHIFDKSRPEMFPFLEKFRKLLDSYNAIMSIGEIGDDHPYKLSAAYTDSNNKLHTTYNTDLMTGTHKSLSQDIFIDPFEKIKEAGGTGWPSWAFSNHDVVRAISRWHHQDPSGFGHDPERSKMLIALLTCLKGTVFLYQGEELGLPESKIPYEKLQDPWGKYLWPEWQGRDGCRTPMPWDNTKPNYGFSEKEPWLPQPHTHKDLCANLQETEPNSPLNFTRNFLSWRNKQKALINGDIEFITTRQERLLAFRRKTKDTSLSCYFNLGNEDIKIDTLNGSILYNQHANKENIQPNGFIIIQS